MRRGLGVPALVRDALEARAEEGRRVCLDEGRDAPLAGPLHGALDVQVVEVQRVVPGAPDDAEGREGQRRGGLEDGVARRGPVPRTAQSADFKFQKKYELHSKVPQTA